MPALVDTKTYSLPCSRTSWRGTASVCCGSASAYVSFGSWAKVRAWRQPGPHGRASVELLARYISPRKASPGFSNPSNGTAVDLTTTLDGTLLTDKSARETWRGSWFHAWLVANAGSHHFHALASGEWHWDYR